jgi:ATP-dependent DNA helicase RecG
MDLDLLHHLLTQPEGERLEFKEWKRKGDAEALGRYGSALANEGGGYLVLGVTDRRPRKIVGTSVFAALDAITERVRDQLGLAVEAAQLIAGSQRVVVFTVPARPRGVPVLFRGLGYQRQGDSLLPMSLDRLRRIGDEIGPDRSAEPCSSSITPGALDPLAIAAFRRAWHATSADDSLLGSPPEQLLEEAGLVQGGRVTQAALWLLGTGRSVARETGSPALLVEHHPTDEGQDPGQRQEAHGGLFLHLESLWQTLRQPPQQTLWQSPRQPPQGLSPRDLAPEESSVREAICNAIAHRDYGLPGPIVVRRFPHRLEVTSPGGFLLGPGRSPGQRAPRNPLVAGTLRRCGLVEGTGQGLDRLDEQALTLGQPRPDFAGTDDAQVRLTLGFSLLHPDFGRFCQRIVQESQLPLSLADRRALAAVDGQQGLSPELYLRLPRLIEAGWVVRQGHGQGASFRLAGGPGAARALPPGHARLDRRAHKGLLLAHLTSQETTGAPFTTLRQVLPQLERSHVQGLLRELCREGKARTSGEARACRWHAVD